MIQKYTINKIDSLKIPLKQPCLVFLKGDLGAGKTTLSKYILTTLCRVKEEITSPTYTYYNKYFGKNIVEGGNEDNLVAYHFDLYRLENYDEFFAIGGEEILDHNTGIILVEWPDILEPYYTPDLEIQLNTTNNPLEREIVISLKK